MRPFTSTISLEEARRRLNAAIVPIARTEWIPLGSAAGRVAASDVASPIDVPPFSRSAMDGYAVIASDTAGATRETPRRLRVLERIYTGRLPTSAVTVGACAEIATGAVVPDGADAVVMVEETARAGEAEVNIQAAAVEGQNIGRRGSDIEKGGVVARSEDVLHPSRVGSLAAIGAASVEVYGRPRVAILSTGNEVVEPGRPLAPGQIYDVNRLTLGAVVEAHGGIAMPHAATSDDLGALERALDACLTADIIVFSGGSSVGERDLVLDLVSKRGTTIFHGIAVKPGKPTLFGTIDGTPFFGMPGNPTSCLSNAYILLVPFLRATARLPAHAPRTVRAPLGRRINSAAGRHTFYTVRLVDGTAQPAFKGSGDITSMSQADGYIEIAADRSAAEEGEMVDVTLL